MNRIYSEQQRRQARRLIRKGMLKTEASKITGVNYATVLRWTGDITVGRGNRNIGGLTLKALREIVAKGYIFADKIDDTHGVYKTLTKYFPVRKARSHGTTVFYLPGNERKTLEAFLEKRGWRSLSWQRLADLRRIFGIKSMKRNNKMMGRLSE